MIARAGERVFALELTSKVAAYVVLEGPERLIVWGGKGLTSDVSAFLPKLEREVLRYRPDVLVLEDPALCRKGTRVQEHLSWIEQWVADQEGKTLERLRRCTIPRPELEAWAAHLGVSKYERALGLARLFPELEELVPPPRKTWLAQSSRLNLFVALTRGLYYYEREEHCQQGDDYQRGDDETRRACSI